MRAAVDTARCSLPHAERGTRPVDSQRQESRVAAMVGGRLGRFDRCWSRRPTQADQSNSPGTRLVVARGWGLWSDVRIVCRRQENTDGNGTVRLVDPGPIQRAFYAMRQWRGARARWEAPDRRLSVRGQLPAGSAIARLAGGALALGVVGG